MYDDTPVKKENINIKTLFDDFLSKVFSLPVKEHCLLFKEFKLATRERLEKETAIRSKEAAEISQFIKEFMQ